MTAQQKPNILLIMADQLTYSALSAYGNPLVKTPNIDRLAREGCGVRKFLFIFAIVRTCPGDGNERAAAVAHRGL